MKVHVVGDEEVVPSIAVVIAKRCTSGPSLVAGKPGLFRYVRECSVAVISIEHHAAEAGHQQVGPAIVVVVTDHRTRGPAGITNARLLSDIREPSIMTVVIERAARLLPAQRHLNALCVRKMNIGPAVAVLVEQRNAAAHRFDDVFLLGTGKVIEIDVCGISDIDQLRQRARVLLAAHARSQSRNPMYQDARRRSGAVKRCTSKRNEYKVLHAAEWDHQSKERESEGHPRAFRSSSGERIRSFRPSRRAPRFRG